MGIRVTRSQVERTGETSALRWQLIASRPDAGAARRFRPIVVLRIAIMGMLVAQLGRIPVLSTGTAEAPLLVNDLFVMSVLAAGLLGALVSRSFRLDRVAGIALVFASVGGISAVLAIPRFGLTALELVVSLAYLARWVVYLGIYIFVINAVRADDVMSLWHTLERMMLVFAAFGIIQSIFIPHFAQVIYPESRLWVDWDEQGHRLVSTVLEPNIAGAMILMVFLVQLAQLAGGERVAFWKPFVLLGALVATLSRSSFVGLFVGGIVILSIRGVSRRMVRFGALVLLVIVGTLPKLIEWVQLYSKLTIDASALSRVANWLRVLRIFSDSPVIGVGFNTFGYVQELYGYTRTGLASNSADGGLLFIAVMTGVVGLTLYLTMLSTILRRCRRVWRDTAMRPEFRALAVGTAAATVAMCVQSLFVNAILTVFVMEPFWILWGLVSVMAWTTTPVARVRPIAQLVPVRPARVKHPSSVTLAAE
jgi:O-antigen ligase